MIGTCRKQLRQTYQVLSAQEAFRGIGTCCNGKWPWPKSGSAGRVYGVLTGAGGSTGVICSSR